MFGTVLLFLTAGLVQLTLPIRLLTAPRRAVLPPSSTPQIATPVHPEPRARAAAAQRQPNVAVSAAPRENQGNSNPDEESPARRLTTSFPLADLPCSPGLYALTNRQTGSVYIGESVNILQRLRSHRSMLEQGEHFCRSLQADFDYYGIGHFEVSILAEGPGYKDAETRRKCEKAYIDQLAPEKRYNVIDRRGDRNSFAGKSHTLAFRERLSAERKGIPNTTLGRPITIPPFRTRKGNGHTGGTFTSIAEASRVTGMARRDIRRRLADPLFPDWREVDHGEKNDGN